MRRIRPLRRDRQSPAYLRMLAGIIVLYVTIIGFGNAHVADPIRVGLLGYLLWASTRLRAEQRERRIALIVASVAFLTSVAVWLWGSPLALYAVVGACSVVLTATAILTIAGTLRGRIDVDIATVLGVLCIYLLFALFFAGLNQLLGAFVSDYLNGTVEPATPSDLLYFSVITLATVGYGDITPASEVARAVTVVEALTGQLYLVSVVAGVVSGWRRPGPSTPDSDTDAA